MKKFFLILGSLVVLLIAVVLVAGMVSPNEMKVERNIVINGSRDVVYDQLSKFHNWQNWSAWAQMDSTMKADYFGEDGQPGSKYHWKGEVIGEGELVNTAVQGHEMRYSMVFQDYNSQADGFIRAEDMGNGKTKAVWSFVSKYSFPMNGIMALMGMQKSLEEDFDKGLATLKGLIETGKVSAPAPTINEVQFPAHTYAVVRKTISWNEMEKFYDESYSTIGKEAGQRITGHPVALFYTWDDVNKKTNMAAGFPVEDNKIVKGATIVEVPASKALMVEFVGNTSESMKAHEAIAKYMQEKGIAQSGLVIEEYVIGASSEKDPSKWVTNIYYLMK